MSIDWNDLSPAPWDACGSPAMLIYDGENKEIHMNERDGGGFVKDADLAFAALARNAFDVMMRRGCCVYSCDDDDGQWWEVTFWDKKDQPPGERHLDPFTALVEADKWAVEQEKNAQAIDKPQTSS